MDKDWVRLDRTGIIIRRYCVVDSLKHGNTGV